MLIEIEIDDNMILGAIGGASIGYWADLQSGQFSRQDFSLVVVERDGRKEYTLGRQSFTKAVRIMSHESPTHLRHLLSGNADRDTGDLLIQYAIFGEAKYG